MLKQAPPVAMANENRSWSKVEFLEGVEERIEQEIGIWHDIFREIAVRHEKYHAAMLHNYLRQENLALHDRSFHFEAGDCVLLRSRVTSASSRGESKMPPDPGSCTCSPALTCQG